MSPLDSVLDHRVGCSSISFRRLPLPSALEVIAGLGFTEIDLGALPGVCDHVPYDLTSAAVDRVVTELAGSGLAVRSVNGDIGDLNAVLDRTARADRDTHLARLLVWFKEERRAGRPGVSLPSEKRRTRADHESRLGVTTRITPPGRNSR